MGRVRTFICMHPLLLCNLGTVLTQFGNTLCIASCRSESWATTMTGVWRSKNSYTHDNAREYDERMAKEMSDFWAFIRVTKNRS